MSNNLKIGLVGGPKLSKYTIADVLWNRISKISGIDFQFEIIEIENFPKLCKFFWEFTEDDSVIGFNVALPWKLDMNKLVDFKDELSGKYESINVVYKDSNSIKSANTDIVGLSKSILEKKDLDNQTVLILGSGGAGSSMSKYLTDKYSCKVYLYDIKQVESDYKKIKILNNYRDIENREYDIVINATPVGKFYLDKIPVNYSSPLSINTLNKILKNDSLLVEMNYFPYLTEFLNQGLFLEKEVVSGVNMLCYQAVETFKYYFGKELDKKEVDELIKFISEYSKEKENELLRKNIA